MKVCSRCKQSKPKTCFSKNKTKRSGLNSYCKECSKQYHKENIVKIKHRSREYYQKNKDAILKSAREYHHSNKKLISKKQKAFRRTHHGIVRELLYGTKRRAKNFNLDHNLTYEFISQLVLKSPRCPVTNVNFTIGTDVIANSSRTIDRLFPEKGYIKDNVLLVSNLANRVKNNGTIDEIELLVQNLAMIQKYKTLPWVEKIKACNMETQTFDGWYIRPNGKKTKMHSIITSGYIRDMKRRAERKKIDFCISKKDLVIPKFCPLLSMPLVRGKGITIDNSPSIDRIDNNLGYSPTNIAVVSHKANVIKNNCSTEQLTAIFNGYQKILTGKLSPKK